MSESTSKPWAEQFDIVPEDVPYEEYPAEEGVQLVCRIDGCDHEQRLAHFGKIEECEWSEIGYDEAILTNGDTLHQGFCPTHSLDEEKGNDPFPLAPAKSVNDESEQDADRYAMYAFAKTAVSLDGHLLRCDSCLRELDIESPTEATEHDWVSHDPVGPLSDGRLLWSGQCPVHRGD